MMRAEAILAMKALLDNGRNPRIEIQGTSMHPYLRAGDRVEIAGVPPARLELGDLIAFLQDGNLIVHRFAGRVHLPGTIGLRQKGDNLWGFGVIPASALIGRVVLVERNTGRRPMLQGRWRWQNRLRGLWAWGFCVARESAARTALVLHLHPRKK
jgi:hypothetical protein